MLLRAAADAEAEAELLEGALCAATRGKDSSRPFSSSMERAGSRFLLTLLAQMRMRGQRSSARAGSFRELSS
jgi:hypothetical protein